MNRPNRVDNQIAISHTQTHATLRLQSPEFSPKHRTDTKKSRLGNLENNDDH